MSEVADATAPSAGRLLREARERQGLHIAALAAAIKVVPKKLELLEADRFDALPDATFTRALAQTVCRALKIDPAPVLKLLPPPLGHRLEHVGTGLNAPFRERPGALVQRDGASMTLSPVLWVSALLLIAAVGLYFVPSGFLGMPHWRGPAAASAAATATPRASPATGAPASAAASAIIGAPATQLAANPESADTLPASADALPVPADSPLATPIGAMPLPGASAPALGDGGVAPGAVQLHTTAPSWIEVTDGSGRALVARLVQPGETIDLEGAAPFRVRIGNASGTQVSYRGQPMELAAYTRDNVARLELK